MTWALWHHEPDNTGTIKPRLDLVEPCWRLVGPSGRVVSCGIYRTEACLELRAGRDEDDILRTQRIPDVVMARVLAERWKRIALATGRFTEST